MASGYLRFCLAAVAASLLAACGAPPKSPYQTTPCPAELQQPGRVVECGEMTLPENRSVPLGVKVVLPVVILRAAKPQTGLPPVIYLHGGPGGSVVGDVAFALEAPEWKDLVGVQQDWIFFDQRGSGRARPFLGCPDQPITDAGPVSAEAARALQTCLQQHRAKGVALAKYNSVEVVRDLQDLRGALGIKAFDLYAISYGTRVAFDLILHSPDGLRAAVLDSPWPLDASWTEPGPVWVSKALQRVLALCEEDSECRAKYPDVGDRFDAVLRSWLAAAPTDMDARDRVGRAAIWIMASLYDPVAVEAVPSNLWRLVNGDDGMLMNDELLAGSGYAEAAHLAFLCNEELPFEGPQAGRVNASGDPVAEAVSFTMTNYFQTCKGVLEASPDAAENRPVTSDAGILMLAAGIDPGCPSELAEMAVRGFPRGRLGLAPFSTHGVLSNSACARRIMSAFLSDPSVEIDLACLAEDPGRPAFD